MNIAITNKAFLPQIEARISMMTQLNYLRPQAKVVLMLVILVVSFSCSPIEEHSIDYLGQDPPGLTAKLFAPALVSTDSFEHSSPAFSPDGTVVLWTVVNKSYRASLMEMKFENGKWSIPHRPSFADSTSDDYYPSFSVDGKKLYFSSRRRVPPGYREADIRIWEIDRSEERETS